MSSATFTNYSAECPFHDIHFGFLRAEPDPSPQEILLSNYLEELVKQHGCDDAVITYTQWELGG